MALHYINFIRIMVLLTCLHAYIGKRLQGSSNHYLLALLTTCLATELMIIVLEIQKIHNAPYMTISLIIHNSLWLLILLDGFDKRQHIPLVLGIFLSFAVTNLLFIEGFTNFNYSTFVVGAFLYLLIFIYHSFNRLKSEELGFFTTNNYLLLCAPLLFFLGLSFMFGFGSRLIPSSPIFKNIILYDCIIYFVNIIYYGLINVYLFNTKRSYAQ